MRIAVLSAACSIHTVRWVNALSRRGHCVALFSLAAHRAPEGALERDIELHYLAGSGAAGYFFGAGALRRQLLAFRPDVLSAHYATGYGTLARRCGFRPLLLSVWGSDVYDFPQRGRIFHRIVSRNIAAATAIASTSRVMAQQVGRVYTGKKKIYITPFGVDTALFHPSSAGREKNTLVVGTVKALEMKYGINYLLEAFSIVRARLAEERRLPPGGMRLEIYGGGSELESLQTLADKLGIADETRFRGKVAHGRVPGILGGLDIFCAPSVCDSESFGVSAVEAMACGVPVVTSDADGFREVVRDGVTGFLAPRRDSAALADRIYRLACDEKLRLKMGRAGRERVREHYEWSNCVKKMESALAQTAAAIPAKMVRK